MRKGSRPTDFKIKWISTKERMPEFRYLRRDVPYSIMSDMVLVYGKTARWSEYEPLPSCHFARRCFVLLIPPEKPAWYSPTADDDIVEVYWWAEIPMELSGPEVHAAELVAPDTLKNVIKIWKSQLDD